MNGLSRRHFLVRAAGVVAASAVVPPSVLGAEQGARIKVGTCMMGLAQAKLAGFDGVEVSAGSPADELDVCLPGTRTRYKEQMQQTGLPITSIMMGVFNQCPLATDPRASAWIRQSVDAAKDLKAKNILLAFFSKGDLLSGTQLKEDEFKAAAQRIKALAPYAKEAGVTLAIENYLNAEQNLRMLELIGDESVCLYYDVFNTGKTKKYDSPAEIRRLKGRIAQVHYKNGSQYLDEDKPHFEAVSAALKDIGYKGWITLETSSPSKNPVEDGKRNAAFVRSLFS
ncbi:MAG: sugar phosphate isomerase/epimerase family protein [bacterium]